MRYCIGSMCAMPLTFSVARARHGIAALALLVVTLAGAGCEGRAPADAHARGAQPARIASLSPAMTECVVELGLADCLAGRTPWCESASPEVPVVGTLLDIDAEALVRTGATMLLVQPPAQGVDPAIETLARRHGWSVHAWRINGLDDACDAMAGLADAVGISDPARARAVKDRHAAWRAAFDSALEPLPPAAAERASSVLVMVGGIEGIAFGRGTYIDDALSRMGVRNALEREGYPALSAEDLLRIAPRTIVLVGGDGPARADRPTIDARSVRVIRLPADGLAVPGGRLPHGLTALRDALASVEVHDGG